MATINFDNSGGSSDWQNLDNWFTSPPGESPRIPAASLPTSSDDVHIYDINCTNSGAQPTVASMTVTGTTVDLDITVTGTSLFLGPASLATGRTLTAGGLASFSGGAVNSGTVNGNASFDNLSANYYIVTGDAAFDNSSNNGDVNGNATFTSGSYHYGIVTGNATFTDSSPSSTSSVGGNYTATNGTYTYTGGAGCTVGGNATFYGSHWGAVNVIGTTTLYDYSIIEGFTNGALTLNDNAQVSYCGWGGTATFNDNSYNNWQYGGGYYGDFAVFNDNAVNNSLIGYATFNDSSQNSENGFCNYEPATFNDDSVDAGYNYGAIYTGRAHAYYNYSYSSCTFQGRSRATNAQIETTGGEAIVITGDPIGSYSGLSGGPYIEVTFTRAGLGINGSSILGLI